METKQEITEIAKVEGGLVEVMDPFAGNWVTAAEATDALLKSARSRLAERREAFAALEAKGADAPLDEVRGLRAAVEADDKRLIDFDRGLRDRLLDLSGMKGLAVQLRGTGTRIDPLSVRGGFAEIVKGLKAREDAATPPKPRHTYFYAVTATDAEHAALRRAIAKVDEGFLAFEPQTDADFRAAERLFKRGSAV